MARDERAAPGLSNAIDDLAHTLMCDKRQYGESHAAAISGARAQVLDDRAELRELHIVRLIAQRFA